MLCVRVDKNGELCNCYTIGRVHEITHKKKKEYCLAQVSSTMEGF